jgi:hypothetical protein
MDMKWMETCQNGCKRTPQYSWTHSCMVISGLHCPVLGWIRECKQKPSPIFVLVD